MRYSNNPNNQKFKGKVDVTKAPGFGMLPPELQGAAISAAEAKYQGGRAMDSSLPLTERLMAGKDAAQNAKYIQGNLTNFRNRVGGNAKPGYSINTDPDSYKQPGRGKGPRDRVRPKLPFVNIPNFDQPTGGSSGGSSGGMNSYNQFEQINGYAVINDSNVPTSFRTGIDTSLYENPYSPQEEPSINTALTARTVVNVIEPDFMNSCADTILRELYSGWKQEVNSNTNGGNKVTDEKFTYDNVRSYLTDVWKGLFYLVELMSRQAWATEDINSNKVLRSQAYFLTSDPQMLTLRNYLASQLSNFVIPKGMYDYAYWFLQVYQTNTHKHAVDQMFVSSHFATYMYGVTNDTTSLGSYRNALTSEVANLSSQNELYSQISALLQAKTSCQWVNLRYIRKPSNTTHFDQSFNDIFANQEFNGRYVHDGVAVKVILPPVVEEPETVPVVFSTELSQVQNHTMETFLNRYSAYAPLLWITSALPTIPSGNTSYQGFNKFVLYESPTARKFAAMPRDKFYSQIGNDALVVKTGFDSTFTLEQDWFIAPKGAQHYLYDVAYPACNLAQRLTAAKIFA